MSIQPDQLRDLIADTLKHVDLYSESAVELLMLTAAQESHCGKYIKQVGGGPARGIFQIEPATHSDLWSNYLRFRPELKAKLEKVSAGINNSNADMHMQGNLIYQIVVARLIYYRKPDPLPPVHQVAELARYWKTHWNTYLGAGTVNEAISNYHLYA